MDVFSGRCGNCGSCWHFQQRGSANSGQCVCGCLMCYHAREFDPTSLPNSNAVNPSVSSAATPAGPSSSTSAPVLGSNPNLYGSLFVPNITPVRGHFSYRDETPPSTYTAAKNVFRRIEVKSRYTARTTSSISKGPKKGNTPGKRRKLDQTIYDETEIATMELQSQQVHKKPKKGSSMDTLSTEMFLVDSNFCLVKKLSLDSDYLVKLREQKRSAYIEVENDPTSNIFPKLLEALPLLKDMDWTLVIWNKHGKMYNPLPPPANFPAKYMTIFEVKRAIDVLTDKNGKDSSKAVLLVLEKESAKTPVGPEVEKREIGAQTSYVSGNYIGSKEDVVEVRGAPSVPQVPVRWCHSNLSSHFHRYNWALHPSSHGRKMESLLTNTLPNDKAMTAAIMRHLTKTPEEIKSREPVSANQHAEVVKAASDLKLHNLDAKAYVGEMCLKFPSQASMNSTLLNFFTWLPTEAICYPLRLYYTCRELELGSMRYVMAGFWDWVLGDSELFHIVEDKGEKHCFFKAAPLKDDLARALGKAWIFCLVQGFGIPQQLPKAFFLDLAGQDYPIDQLARFSEASLKLAEEAASQGKGLQTQFSEIKLGSRMSNYVDNHGYDALYWKQSTLLDVIQEIIKRELFIDAAGTITAFVEGLNDSMLFTEYFCDGDIGMVLDYEYRQMASSYDFLSMLQDYVTDSPFSPTLTQQQDFLLWVQQAELNQLKKLARMAKGITSFKKDTSKITVCIATDRMVLHDTTGLFTGPESFVDCDRGVIWIQANHHLSRAEFFTVLDDLCERAYTVPYARHPKMDQLVYVPRPVVTISNPPPSPDLLPPVLEEGNTEAPPFINVDHFVDNMLAEDLAFLEAQLPNGFLHDEEH